MPFYLAITSQVPEDVPAEPIENICSVTFPLLNVLTDIIFFSLFKLFPMLFCYRCKNCLMLDLIA